MGNGELKFIIPMHDIDVEKKISVKKNNKKEKVKKEKESTLLIAQSLFPEYDFSNVIQEKIMDWLNYKDERRDHYQEQGLRALMRRIENKSKEHGDSAVCEVIEESMANGYKGIIFDRLKEKQEKKHRTLDRIMYYVEHYFQLCGYDEKMLKFISPLLKAMFEELDFEDEDSGDRGNDGKGSGLGGHHTPLNSVNPINSENPVNSINLVDLLNSLKSVNPSKPLDSTKPSNSPKSLNILNPADLNPKPSGSHKEPDFLDLLFESDLLKTKEDSSLTAEDKKRLNDKI